VVVVSMLPALPELFEVLKDSCRCKGEQMQRGTGGAGSATALGDSGSNSAKISRIANTSKPSSTIVSCTAPTCRNLSPANESTKL
jgi:hypothetical protein